MKKQLSIFRLTFSSNSKLFSVKIYFVPLIIMLFNLDLAYGALNINTATTWAGLSSGDQTTALNTGIVINPGGSLTISSVSLSFASGVIIKVNSSSGPADGGKLIITNSTLNSSSGTWGGIEVWGQPNGIAFNEPQFVVATGFPSGLPIRSTSKYLGTYNPLVATVDLQGGTIIQNADIGFFATIGGIVSALGTTSGSGVQFIDCIIAIKFDLNRQNIPWYVLASSQLHPSAYKLNFITFIDNFSHATDMTNNPNRAQVIMDECGKVVFGGCTFHANPSSAQCWDKRGVAIQVEDASLCLGEAGNATDYHPSGCLIIKMHGYYTTTYRSTVENFSIGILATQNQNQDRALEINNTDFLNNFVGVHADGYNNLIRESLFKTEDSELENNDRFKVDGACSPPSSSDVKRHVFLENARLTVIYSNKDVPFPFVDGGFEFDNSNTNYPVGPLVEIEGTGKKINVVINEFTGGSGSSNPQAPQGLLLSGSVGLFNWKCNTFSENDVHVQYAGTGPYNNPMDLSPAGNIYDANGTTIIDNQTSQPLEYYSNLTSVSPSNDVHLNTITMEDPTCLIDCNGFEAIFNKYATVEKITKNPMSIFPNPAENKISIEFEGTFNYQTAVVNLYNISGMKLKQLEVDGSFMTINVDDLSAGMYLIELNIDHQKFSKLIAIK